MLRVTEHSSPQIRFEAECKAIEIISEARATATQILMTNKAVMEAMTEKLLEKEELDQDELRVFKDALIDAEETLMIAA
jgi:ATP-dependent Zn protease